jgi:signal transduction histidine kinase
VRTYSVLLFLSVALWHIAEAQSPKIDSLKKRLQASTGTEHIDLQNAYAYALASYDYLEAQKIIQESLQRSNELNYKKGMAEALLNKGIIESNIGQDSLSMISFRKSLFYSEQAKERQLEGRTLTSMGLDYLSYDKVDSATICYQQAYEALKDSINPLYLSYLYLNLAELHRTQSNQRLQLSYLIRSWEIRIRLKEKHALVWTGVGLSSYYTDQGDYKKALSYLNRVQNVLEQDTIDSEEFAIINKQRGIINANLGNHELALDLFGKAKKYYERNPYLYDLINLLMEIGYVQADVSNYETSLKYYYQAIKLAESNHFHHLIARLYFRIAWVYYLMEQNDLSSEFSHKALTLSTTRHHESEESSALNLLGLLASRKKKKDEALDYFNRSLSLREKNNYRDRTASTLLNLGILYEQFKDFSKAESFDLKSLSIEEEISHAYGICESYQSLGQLYTKMKNFDKATYYLNRGELLSKKINAENILTTIYKNKRDLYRAQNKYAEAYRYAVLHQSLKDSVFNTIIGNRILTLQHDFELDQKDSEIKILNQQRQLQQGKLDLQQAEIKRQWYIIAVGLVIFLNTFIGSFIVFRFYKKVKKLNREVSEQNEEITAQSEELMESNDILSKLNREISEQKEEIQAQAEELTESNETISRVNIGLEEKVKERTLELKEAYTELDTFFYRSSHDFRRPLTTFMGLAEVAKITVKDTAALELFEKVNETARNLDKMLLKLQSVSVAGSQELIYSEVMIEQILQIELDNFRDEILRKAIQVLIDVKLPRPFFSYPALVKFIIQNLLENSIAFSGVASPFIKFSAREVEGEVILEVSDNGQGIEVAYLHRVFEMYFRANERSRGNGLGLYIVKKMVDKLNGRIDLKSEYGIGTKVAVYLPNNFKP